MLEQLFEKYRPRLRRMVELRIDRRVAPRFDASDVIQDAYAEAVQRYDGFRVQPSCSDYVWLRFLTLQKLAQLQRKHLAVQGRTVLREHRIDHAPEVNSETMASLLAGRELTPSGIVAKLENQQQLASAIETLKPADREILAMRHFEQLSNAEVAEILAIETDAAYRRYIRALRRLQKLISEPMTG